MSSITQERAAIMRRSYSLRHEIWKNRASYMLMAPYFILFFLFTVVPVLMSIYLSFTYFNMLEAPRLIGWTNYVKLILEDDIFTISLRNTLLFAVITVPISYMLCLLFAWIINEFKPKVRALLTLVFYAPSICGNAYMVWNLILTGDRYGYLNGILLKLDLINNPILWMQTEKYVMPVLIIVQLWLSLGTGFQPEITGRENILLNGMVLGFSEKEIRDITSQPFCKSVGAFTSSQYRVVCSLGMQGVAQMGTEMFFESVPDRFVDTDLRNWTFSPEDDVVPIVLPRSYLAIYNFGFAQSQSLPKISEGIIGMIDMVVVLRGNGQEQRLKGKVIGFSSRLNTILVPESFIRWSNAKFAPEADLTPNRVIVEVKNPTDDTIVKYMNKHNLELEDDKLDAGKATYFLRVVTVLVMCIGLLISILSFYILMLSIYLLVQKNTEKLRNLLLIGYSPARVSLPYQLLTVGMNAVVLLFSFIILYMVRLWVMFPQMQDGSLSAAFGLGLCLFAAVSLINIVAVRNRVMKIWNRKE